MVTGTADLDPCHLWQNISMSINVIFCLWNSGVVEKVKENLPIYLYGQSVSPYCRISYERCRYHRSYEKEYKTCSFLSWRKDTYVYPNNSFQNYMLCKAPKELVIVQGARHLCSAYADPELYQRTVMEFFEKYDGSNSEK